ncbi:hypothetical protein ACFOWM_03955 [Ferruginibacter yonginensis]|uniref:Esterase n=1 Tax=Ferruginibacter yonginensis TaxID=1310416 RepID=A0ABV8QSY5_9BACT
MKITKRLCYFIFLAFVSMLFSCKSATKKIEDSLYSRHLQRNMPITIISTSVPDNKSDYNLLLFNQTSMLDVVNAQKIIDSLFKKKQIQPLIVVAFEGKSGPINNEYGLSNMDNNDAKKYKKLHDFIINELYPFVKKKAGVRKFNTVGILGFKNAAVAAFDVCFNNDEKINKVGMFYPDFTIEAANDSITLANIGASRKRPTINIWVTDVATSFTTKQFCEMMQEKKSIQNLTYYPTTEVFTNNKNRLHQFAAFLLWAFPQ